MRILLRSFLLLLLCSPVSAQQYPERNAAASADYDAKLKAGDKGIAVGNDGMQRVVKILQRTDSLYQAAPPDITEWELKNRPNSAKWYKANSIYPYYDLPAFKSKAGKYEGDVKHLLLCFAQKYKFRLDIVTGQKTWPTYFLKDEAEKQSLLKKLEELYTILQGMGELPNTFLSFESNPRMWFLIARDREEYVNCLALVKDPDKGRIVDMYLKEIEKSKTAAQNFTGGTDGLYNAGSFEWMYRALSPSRRTEFIKTQTGWNDDAEIVAKLNKALDDLKTVCAPKVSLLKMSDDLFKYRDAASEAVMKNHLKNPPTLKIMKTGMSDNDWLIAKNDYGIPLYRYKRGQMWVKNSADDHGYCKGLYFVVRQDYSGGGTYGASHVNNYIEELYGCP
ncbi:MAG: hypothetical protein FD123_3222 [Bacteroidetes bacterium]|nr:MAG: hypothetical protein FD123_3222 [Bacteroidota bacterium]